MVGLIVGWFTCKSELDFSDYAILEDHVDGYINERRLDIVLDFNDVELRNLAQEEVGML